MLPSGHLFQAAIHSYASKALCDFYPKMKHRSTLAYFAGPPFSRRSLSSLGNPMFPEKKQQDLADVMDEHSKELRNNKGTDKSGGVADVLADHGGKIAAVSVVLIVMLIYSYYESGQNRNRIEEAVKSSMYIEPFEIQELRYMNQLRPKDYARIVDCVRKHFSSGEPVSYSRFVAFVRNADSLADIRIRSTHILDRFAAQHLPVTEAASSINSGLSADSNNEQALERAATPQLGNRDKLFDVNALLVLLSMCILGGESDADPTRRLSHYRIEELFNLAVMIETDGGASQRHSEDADAYVESYEQQQAAKISRRKPPWLRLLVTVAVTDVTIYILSFCRNTRTNDRLFDRDRSGTVGRMSFRNCFQSETDGVRDCFSRRFLRSGR